MVYKIDSQKSNLSDTVKALNSIKEEIRIEFNEEDVYLSDLVLPILNSNEKVTIYGNGATLKGSGNGTALIITGKNITIENLKVEGFYTGILILAKDQNVENVVIRNCEFKDIVGEATASAITGSGLKIDGVNIEDCFFEAPTRERGGHCSCATNLMTASYNAINQPIHNVVLRNVTWIRNHLVPNPIDGNLFSLGFTAHGACNHSFYESKEMLNSSYNDVSYSIVENLLISNNEVDGVYDIGITALAGLPGRFDCLLQNVVISGNKIIYNNTAINVGTTNIPCNGDVKRCITRNVLIKGNTVIPRVPGPFEPQIGIMLFTIRAESQTIRCTDCHMEDIIVCNNNVKGREVGIALQAFHATQDLPYPSYLANCSLKRVTIFNNRIHEAQRAIRIFTAHLEGRYDDFWGYKLPEFDRKLPYSTRCEHGLIDEINIRDNVIEEYDCAVTVGAAWACGFSFVKDCVVGPNFIFSGNNLDGGRKVFCYKKYISDNILYDDAVGIENYVDQHVTI